jgi:hypothetical protein
MASRSALAAQLESFETEDKTEPLPPSDIVAYNELRTCADLYRLFASGKLEIQPDFQIEVVWRADEQTRFIDSLVKRLPIPSMCFSFDYKTQRWQVIDGLQRMTSIINLLSDVPWKMSDLTDINAVLRNKTNLQLRTTALGPDNVVSLVEDVSIPITVIRCDYNKNTHLRYLFTIFHRLNSGGVRLNNQEIRNCIYTGSFNAALKAFDRDNKDWAALKGRIWGGVKRFRSVEILLRILAFADKLKSYDGNLARFLNDYMHSRMSENANDLRDLTATLSEVARIGRIAMARTWEKVPVSQFEAILVGIMTNLEKLKKVPDKRIQLALEGLRKQPSFVEAARYAVNSVENVRSRVAEANRAFASA